MWKFLNDWFTKQLRTISLLTLVAGCFLMVPSCTYYTNEYEEVVVPDEVSFDADVIPIFEVKCNWSGCHNGSIPPDLRPSVAYNNIIFGGYVTDTTRAENNSFYQKIDGGSMRPYASDQDRAIIKQWIESGALNN